MFDNIENLKIISTLHKTNKPFVKIESRKHHSFFIRMKGSIQYDFYGRKIIAKEGDLIFLPKGSSYTAKVLSEDSMYTAIHFEADFAEMPKPVCYSLENFYDAEYIANCFSDLWNFGTQAEKYQCVSLAYKLLSYLSTVESEDNSKQKKFEIIEPAVVFLKEHIYDCTLKTDKLHRLCGISGTYFRQIFLSRFGTTPQNYILSKRLSHAKAIISSGDFNTISEVALSIGFNDPLYFSKAFKKAYGISPSALNKN